MRGRLLAIGALLAIASWGCGGGSEVGEDIAVEDGSGAQGGPRLGERAPTPTPAEKPASTPAPNRPAPPTPAPRPESPAFVIKIQSDNAPGGSQFEPRLARVQRGAVVRWQNTDSKPRSVEADNGAFRSPSIPPGGSWDYNATAPGSFNYHDGTRPYAVGSLEVA